MRNDEIAWNFEFSDDSRLVGFVLDYEMGFTLRLELILMGFCKDHT